VKAVLRDIRGKLGPDWRERVPPKKPGDEAGYKALEGRAGPAFEAGVSPSGDKARPAGSGPGREVPEAGGTCLSVARYEREAREGRRVAASLLLRSHGRTLLKVSGDQRFFLKPVLGALEAERYLRLLAADRHDRFAPPWLPVVNRGRRAVRAAVYLVCDEPLVRAALEEYLRAGLSGYVAELSEKLAAARSLTGPWRRAQLPDEQELWTWVRQAFDLDAQTPPG